MNDSPDAIELLHIARRSLLESVLPAVPDALRYTTLMIANAMAIAAREIAAGDAAAEAALARMRKLLGERPQPVDHERVHEALRDYDRRLGAAIREGRFDGEHRPALLEHLLATTTAKVAVSNPKALDT